MTEYSAVIVVQSNEAGQPTNLLALGNQDTLAKDVLPPDIQSLPGDVTAISDSTGALQPLLPITGDLLGLEGELTAINAATGTLSPLLPITGTLTALDGIVTGPGGVLDDINDLYDATGSIADATGSLDPLTSVLPLTGPGIVDGLLDLEGDVTALQEATGLNYFSITGLNDATGGLEGDVTALYEATGVIVDATGPLDIIANETDPPRLRVLSIRGDILTGISDDYGAADGGGGTLLRNLDATATQLGPLTGIVSNTGGLVDIYDDYNIARGGGGATILNDIKDGTGTNFHNLTGIAEATGTLEPLTSVLPLTGPGIVDELLDVTADVLTLFDQTGLNFNDITGIAEATGTLNTLTGVLPLTATDVIPYIQDLTGIKTELVDIEGQVSVDTNTITVGAPDGFNRTLEVFGSIDLTGLPLAGEINGLKSIEGRTNTDLTIDSGAGKDLILRASNNRSIKIGTAGNLFVTPDFGLSANNWISTHDRLKDPILGSAGMFAGTGTNFNNLTGIAEATGTLNTLTGVLPLTATDVVPYIQDLTGIKTDLVAIESDYSLVGGTTVLQDLDATANQLGPLTGIDLLNLTGINELLDLTSVQGDAAIQTDSIGFLFPGGGTLSGVNLIRPVIGSELKLLGAVDNNLQIRNKSGQQLIIGLDGPTNGFSSNDFAASAANWSEVYDACVAGDIGGGGGATSIASAIHYSPTVDLPIFTGTNPLPDQGSVLRYNTDLTGFEIRRGPIEGVFTYDGTSLGIDATSVTFFNLGDATVGGGNSLDFSASFTTSGNTKSLLEFDDKSRVALGRNSVPLEISANGEADVRLEDDGTDGAFVLIKGTKVGDSPSISQVHLQSADLSADTYSLATFDSPIATNNTIEANGGKGSSHPTAGGQVLQSRGSSTAVTWGNKKKLRWYESDFHSADVRINGPWLGAAVNAGTTGAGVSPTSLWSEMIGAVLLKSSTTADSGYRWDSQAMDRIAPRKNLFFECIFAVPDDFTNKTAKLGFYDDVTNATAAVDGTYFLIDNSGNITPETANNSTRTTGATYALSVDTVYKAQIWWSTSTTAIFKLTDMDESTVHQTWTISTNLPSGTGRRFGAGVVAKSSGTAVDELFVLDYMGWGLYPYREDDSI